MIHLKGVTEQNTSLMNKQQQKHLSAFIHFIAIIRPVPLRLIRQKDTLKCFFKIKNM